MEPPATPEQPPPDAAAPSPPELQTRRLWLSLLLPSALLLGAILLYVVVSLPGSPARGTEFVITAGLHLFWISGIACWILFGQVMQRRYQGASPLLMILAYPFIQLALAVAIAFGSCAVGMAVASIL